MLMTVLLGERGYRLRLLKQFVSGARYIDAPLRGSIGVTPSAVLERLRHIEKQVFAESIARADQSRQFESALAADSTGNAGGGEWICSSALSSRSRTTCCARVI
jgi:hypothetical protein